MATTPLEEPKPLTPQEERLKAMQKRAKKVAATVDPATLRGVDNLGRLTVFALGGIGVFSTTGSWTATVICTLAAALMLLIAR